MALKCEYVENCSMCGAHVCRATNRGVKFSPSVCACDKREDDDSPPSPPRTISWRSATLTSADGKIKWLHNTIFLALEDDMWHHRDVIEKGKYYWLDETWSIGGNADSYDDAKAAQVEYGKML